MKVNVFIVHTPEDKSKADKLMEWLFPIRDEVNLWHYSPPAKPESLPLSWRILMPWYRPADPGVLYREPLNKRRENAHIYVFLTSSASIHHPRLEEDLSLALARKADCVQETLAPLMLPLVWDKSEWKKGSRLCGFEPLLGGKPIVTFPSEEEGLRQASGEIAALIKVVQSRLVEAKYYQLHAKTNPFELRSGYALPYLGEHPEQFEFDPPAPFRPADWLGWSLIALIVLISAGSFRKTNAAVSSLHLKARPDYIKGVEYPRENPVSPTHDTSKMKFPPVEQ